MAAEMSTEINRLHSEYVAGRFDPMKSHTILRHLLQMRQRGGAAANMAGVFWDTTMDDTVA